jgi:hypothetical protein
MTDDPLNDLERRVEALAARVNLEDALIKADIDGIHEDIARLRKDHDTAVARSWAMVVLVLTAAAGGMVALLTRQS